MQYQKLLEILYNDPVLNFDPFVHQNSYTLEYSQQSRHLNPALLKYVMLVDVFPFVSRQHGRPIPKGFFLTNGAKRLLGKLYLQNCTILIFVTAKAVKGVRESVSYQILKKCEVKFSQIKSRLDSYGILCSLWK